jgi:hypothetical protein
LKKAMDNLNTMKNKMMKLKTVINNFKILQSTREKEAPNLLNFVFLILRVLIKRKVVKA